MRQYISSEDDPVMDGLARELEVRIEAADRRYYRTLRAWTIAVLRQRRSGVKWTEHQMRRFMEWSTENWDEMRKLPFTAPLMAVRVRVVIEKARVDA